MAAKSTDKIYQIKVTLKGSKPPIWRRLLVSNTITLGQLHEVLQIAMGWTNSHLHQFIAGESYYGLPDPDFDLDVIDEGTVKLNQLLKQEKDAIIYEYDFGDGWEHKVELEKILPFDPEEKLPSCIKGRRACLPEDVGGAWGYREFLESIQDPAHSEYEELLEWIGGEFDPEYFSVQEVNDELSEYIS
ncbi:MAG: plasmid pRiA4b ORF-3 family protein [Oscillatoriales cyanobacterium RM1_1_9]|nr:plasmid pRiA4b ORF-3 family protein [Oscillatoriales cyanobacterium RM2_1_1]NJO70613.1 plasmid pRiA4b ORF-3 family protein [Oscillatoriales cyanobacterium RM1_1_9]